MVYKAKILIILHLFYLNSFAQVSPGAKDVALSHSTIALSNDVFCLFSNPSGLAQLNWREIGLYYSPSPFGLSELANFYGAYNEPTGAGSFGLGFMSYGFDLYRQIELALSYANSFENSFLFGITTQYHSLSIKGYGSTSYLTIVLGSIIYLSPDLRIGFSIDNILRMSIAGEDNQIPVIYTTGLSYNVLNYLNMNFAIRKEIDKDGTLSFGIDYEIISYLNIRFGFRNFPASLSAGVGINYSEFELDYAVFNHSDLGLTHQIGLVIHFGKDIPRSERIKSSLNLSR
jgi:hypothetical protein